MPTFIGPRNGFAHGRGNEALVRSIEGAEDEVVVAEQLVRLHVIDSRDVVIAVAASGTTASR